MQNEGKILKQKWEYCVIIRMPVSNNTLPKVYRITNKGYELVEDFDKFPKGVRDVVDAVAMLIAQLGIDGWEMVGAGSTHEGSSHSLYFKRQIE